MSRALWSERPQWRLRLYKLAFALGILVPYRVGMVLAMIIGIICWLVDSQGRAQVRRNLRPLMRQAHAGTLLRAVRRSYIHCLLMFNETFRLGSLPRWLVSPDNIQIVDPFRVFAQRPLPGPAIICTVHVNWELLLAASYHLDLTGSTRVVARSNGDEHIDMLFDRMRAGHGARSLLLDGAPLASLRALREKRILGIVADRDYAGNGLLSNFAGQRLRLPVGPAALAVQTGSPIIPVLFARRGSCAFTLVVGKPIHPDSQQAKQQQLPQLVHALGATMDRFLRAVPSQWVAFHNLQHAADLRRSSAETGLRSNGGF